MRKLLNSATLVAVLPLLAVGLFGQTAQLTGTVTDSSGSVVPNAKVKATNLETGVARDSVTNDAGNYLVTALLPGRYRVTAEAAGFKQVKHDLVTLAVDQVGRIDFAMEVGETKESVTVEASAVLLDSATSTIGTGVVNRPISEQPLRGREPLRLLALSPRIRI